MKTIELHTELTSHYIWNINGIELNWRRNQYIVI